MQPRPFRLADWCALAFAMSFPSIMSWLEFMALTGPGEESSPGLQSVFGIGKIIQFSFPLAYVHWIAGEKLQFSRPKLAGMGWALGFAGVVAVGMAILYWGFLKDSEILGSTPAKIHEWLHKIGAASPLGFVLMAGFVSIPHSFLEEYYWRWFVFGRLKRHVPLPFAIGLGSLAFMGHHLVVLAFYFPGNFWLGAVPFSLCVAFGGGVWAWMYHRSGNLYAPWLSHLLVDLAIMVVGFDLVRPYFSR